MAISKFDIIQQEALMSIINNPWLPGRELRTPDACRWAFSPQKQEFHLRLGAPARACTRGALDGRCSALHPSRHWEVGRFDYLEGSTDASVSDFLRNTRRAAMRSTSTSPPHPRSAHPIVCAVRKAHQRRSASQRAPSAREFDAFAR